MSTTKLHERIYAPYGVFGPAARGAHVRPTVSAGRRVEGNRSVEPGLTGR
jgi:hypothetical protein